MKFLKFLFVFLSIFGGILFAENCNEKGLVAYWSFDEGKGKVVRDAITQKDDYINYVFNNAIYKPPSDPQWKNFGIKGNSLLFDGFSTWIKRDADEFVKIDDALTIEVWVAPRAYGYGDGGKLSALVDQHNSREKEGFVLGIYRHGSWAFEAGIGDQWIEVWVHDKPIEKYKWSYVVVTFDKNKSEINLYLNGEKVAFARTPQGKPINVCTRDLLIGKNNESVRLAAFDLNMFNGLMDELRIYKKALTSEEIKIRFEEYISAHGGKIPEVKWEDTINPELYKGDKYRPQYHAIPPEHWMNEPHAPLYYRGKYHLFYQHNPQGPYWHNIHWGHWVSDDMVHWRDLPIALAPEAGTLDPDGCWSGSATYDENGIPVIFYTAGNDKDSPNQRIALARPENPQDPYLIKWKKYPRPVVVQKQGEGLWGEFRDPFVWKDENEKKWYMLVGTGHAEKMIGAALIYTSVDLINWEYKGYFYYADPQKYPFLGRVWELPVFLPVGKDERGNQKYIFLVSPKGGYADIEVWYWIGIWDKENYKFVPDHEEPQKIDLGDSHFTGPSGFVDPKSGRTIIFTIAQDERNSTQQYMAGWAHNAGLPVVVGLDKSGELLVEPIRELMSLREKELINLKDKTLEETNYLIKEKDVKGDMLEIILELEAINAKKFGIKVRCSPGGEEETFIFYDSEKKILGVDRNLTSVDLFSPCHGIQGGPLDLRGENLKLHIFLDHSMVEVYANKKRSLTTRVYPSREDSLGLQICADGKVIVRDLKIWKMKAIK